MSDDSFYAPYILYSLLTTLLSTTVHTQQNSNFTPLPLTPSSNNFCTHPPLPLSPTGIRSPLFIPRAGPGNTFPPPPPASHPTTPSIPPSQTSPSLTLAFTSTLPHCLNIPIKTTHPSSLLQRSTISRPTTATSILLSAEHCSSVSFARNFRAEKIELWKCFVNTKVFTCNGRSLASLYIWRLTKRRDVEMAFSKRGVEGGEGYFGVATLWRERV